MWLWYRSPQLVAVTSKQIALSLAQVISTYSTKRFVKKNYCQEASQERRHEAGKAAAL